MKISHLHKYYYLIIFFFLLVDAAGQSRASFKINLQYAQSQRPGLELYLEDLSDSMNLPAVPDIHSGFGFGFGFLIGGSHTEFEGGGGYTRSADEIGSDTSNLLYYNNSDIAIYLGLNYLPVNFFLLGGSFIINSTNAKCNETGLGLGEKYLEPLPSKNFHVFRGYSVALRAQSGFYIYLNKDENMRMRLTGYYIYGLSKYNFYTVSEKRLAGFEGDQKTNCRTAGIELAILFGM